MMQNRERNCSVRIAVAVSLLAGPTIAASSAVSAPVALAAAPLQVASAARTAMLEVRSSAAYATVGTSFSSKPSGGVILIR